jgi:KDO2-lipid IV(A) lauroyltransferase
MIERPPVKPLTAPKQTSRGAGAGATDDGSTPLSRFWRLRHWPAWIFLFWLRTTALLPWRTAIKVHKAIGRVAGRLLRRRRAIVRRNIEICFPLLDRNEVDRLVSLHFESAGAFCAELAFAWFAGTERFAHLFRIEGREHLETALAKGNGVLLFSGHFTALEICVPMLKTITPLFAFMSRSRRDALLNEVQTRGRHRAGHIAIPNDDVRALLRALARNAAVWYAPDQVRIDRGELLPFFGELCMMSTSTSRVARHSGAAILPLFFCRLADDSGYVIRFNPPLDDLPSADPVHDTIRLTAVLEEFVRECPDQYIWTHRKFKSRPGGLPDIYQSS